MNNEQASRLVDLEMVADGIVRLLDVLERADVAAEERATHLRAIEASRERSDAWLRRLLGELLDAGDREGLARAALLWPAFAPDDDMSRVECTQRRKAG